MLNVAVVGATGLVGEKLVTILAEKLPNAKLLLFANESSGKKVQAMGKTYVVEHVEKLLCTKLDVAMFMANEQVAKTYVPPLANRGVLCVDNSSQ
ncbi:MAG: aspartate-semialdehyde dehydrogenase, partial [Clostridia bacterium]|nr:aspartate-semialdehyde dehydrogenase [Clostridia bacterium]